MINQELSSISLTGDSFLPGADPRSLRRGTIVPRVANPFENPAPWTIYEIFKACLLCWSLFAVRLLVLIPVFLLHILICVIGTCGVQPFDDRGTIYVKEPFPLWRQILLWPTAITNRILLWCFGFWPCSISVVDKRKNKTFAPKVLVVAPHRTFLDPFIIAVLFPPLPSGVGKKELLSLPLLGRLGLATQGLYVDRHNPESRHSCKEAIAAHSRQDWKGPPMVIFPEGTTTNGQILIQFKLGPFCPGEPVQPVLLEYATRFYDPSWCGNNGNLAVAIGRSMLQFANFCKVTLEDPYFPSEDEQKDAKLFANNVRAQMATALGVETTEHSYDDLFLSASARSAHIDQDFEAFAMKKKYNLDLEQLKEMLKQFQKLDKDRDGKLTHDEFVSALRATDGGPFSDDATIDRLFDFFDIDGAGVISYREFVQGISILSGKCSNESRAKLAFLVFDAQGTGRVRTSLLKTALDNPLQHEASEGQSMLGASVVKAAGGQTELDYENFCKMVQDQPAVVDEAMEIVRRRFGLQTDKDNKSAASLVPTDWA